MCKERELPLWAFLLWIYHPIATLDLEKAQTEQLARFRLFFLQPNTLPTEGLHVYVFVQLLFSTQASNLTTKHTIFLGHLNSPSMRRKWVISQLHSLYKQNLPISLYSLDHNCCFHCAASLGLADPASPSLGRILKVIIATPKTTISYS